MVESLFTDIVLNKNWSSLSFEDKLKLLQKLEYELSKEQKREERELVQSFTVFENEPPAVIYSPFNRTKIKLANINNLSPEDTISMLYGSTFNAMCDDYLKNKANIRTYLELKNEKLEDEASKLDLLFLLARSVGAPYLMELSSYQGVSAKNDAALYMLDKISAACETEKDCSKFLDIYYNIFETIYNRDKLVEKYAKLGITFSDLKQKIDKIDFKVNKSLLNEIKTNKIIFSCIKPEVLGAFNRGYKIFNYGMASPTMFEELYANELIENFVNLSLNKKR